MNAILLSAAIAVRNPFWPIGYEGVREVISAEPTVEVKASTTTADDDTATAAMAAHSSQTVSTRHWVEARKSLRIGGTVVVTGKDDRKRQCIMINGLAYGDGDLISANHNGRRFTWLVQGLTDGATIKLKRIRAKRIDDEPAPTEQKNKETNKWRHWQQQSPRRS